MHRSFQYAAVILVSMTSAIGANAQVPPYENVATYGAACNVTTITTTGSASTSGTEVINVSSTTGMTANSFVADTTNGYIPHGTIITAVNSSTQLAISKPTTGNISGDTVVVTAGTDDTSAFQAAATAAANTYAATGQPVKIYFSGNCLINGVVSYGSGVWWEGLGGTITVTSQAGYTFEAMSADDVAWDNMVINVLGLPQQPYNSGENVINWTELSADAKVHHGVYIRNNVIHNSNWGVYVIYATTGTGSLTDVNISGNTVDSTTPFANADGIHVDGNVTNITIEDNRVFNRGDACIGLTADSTNILDIPDHWVVADNVCTNVLVGVDISGASYGTVAGNRVTDTISPLAQSDPAFRIIWYGGNAPSNITVVGNYFQLLSGSTDAQAKIDINGSVAYANGTIPPDCNCTITGNTFYGGSGQSAFYIRANRVNFSNNTMLSGASLNVDYSAPPPSTLTSYSASGSTVSLTNSGTNGLAPTQTVTFSGVTVGPTCLNGLTLPVLSTGLSATTFQVSHSGCSGMGTANGIITPTQVPTQNVIIGTNNWLGTGYLGVSNNAGLISNVQAAPQNAVGTLTNANPSVETIPNGYPQTVAVAGCNFPAQANGNVCHQAITMPQMHTSTAYSVNCSLSTNLTGTGGQAPTLSWTANIGNTSQFDLYEQSVVATSSWTSYPNYQVVATCTTVHP